MVKSIASLSVKFLEWEPSPGHEFLLLLPLIS